MDTWSIFHKIDFKKYDLQPSYKVMKIFSSELLGATSQSKVLSTQVLDLVRHKFSMEDDLIHFGQKTSTGNFYQINKSYKRPVPQEMDEDIIN